MMSLHSMAGDWEGAIRDTRRRGWLLPLMHGIADHVISDAYAIQDLLLPIIVQRIDEILDK